MKVFATLTVFILEIYCHLILVIYKVLSHKLICQNTNKFLNQLENIKLDLMVVSLKLTRKP